MATIVLSEFATGVKPTHLPDHAGDCVNTKSQYIVTTSLTTGHILDWAVLPAFCVPVAYELYTEGSFAGPILGDIGIMTGDVGSTDTARTVGNEFFDDVDLTVARTVGSRLQALLNLAPSDRNRSIGFVPSNTITAASTKKLTLSLTYAAAHWPY